MIPKVKGGLYNKESANRKIQLPDSVAQTRKARISNIAIGRSLFGLNNAIRNGIETP